VNNILGIKFCFSVEPTSEGGARLWALRRRLLTNSALYVVRRALKIAGKFTHNFHAVLHTVRRTDEPKQRQRSQLTKRNVPRIGSSPKNCDLFPTPPTLTDPPYTTSVSHNVPQPVKYLVRINNAFHVSYLLIY